MGGDERERRRRLAVLVRWRGKTAASLAGTGAHLTRCWRKNTPAAASGSREGAWRSWRTAGRRVSGEVRRRRARSHRPARWPLPASPLPSAAPAQPHLPGAGQQRHLRVVHQQAAVDAQLGAVVAVAVGGQVEGGGRLGARRAILQMGGEQPHDVQGVRATPLPSHTKNVYEPEVFILM